MVTGPGGEIMRATGEFTAKWGEDPKSDGDRSRREHHGSNRGDELVNVPGAPSRGAQVFSGGSNTCCPGFLGIMLACRVLTASGMKCLYTGKMTWFMQYVLPEPPSP